MADVIAWHKAATWKDDQIESVERPTEESAVTTARERIEALDKTRGRVTLNSFETRVMRLELQLLHRPSPSKTILVEMASQLHIKPLEVVQLLNRVSDIETARALCDMPPIEGKTQRAPQMVVLPKIRNEKVSHYRHKASWKRAA